MRNIFDIPYESRTVWVCLIGVAMGVADTLGYVELDPFSTFLILAGLAGAYQRAKQDADGTTDKTET